MIVHPFSKKRLCLYFAERQKAEIYTSTDQDQEMRIERSAKFYADSIQSEAMFDVPLTLKLLGGLDLLSMFFLYSQFTILSSIYFLVPPEKREALLKNYRRIIRKREDRPTPHPARKL